MTVPTETIRMSHTSSNNENQTRIERFVKVVVSVVALVPVTVFVGYGGGLVLTLVAVLGGPDPETEDGDLLRRRLLAWPDRNRDVMRTNGRADLPLKP